MLFSISTSGWWLIAIAATVFFLAGMLVLARSMKLPQDLRSTEDQPSKGAKWAAALLTPVGLGAVLGVNLLSARACARNPVPVQRRTRLPANRRRSGPRSDAQAVHRSEAERPGSRDAVRRAHTGLDDQCPLCGLPGLCHCSYDVGIRVATVVLPRPTLPCGGEEGIPAPASPPSSPRPRGLSCFQE